MFNFFKKKKDKTAAETPAPTHAASAKNAPESAAPVVKAIKIYTIALDQSCKMARELLNERGFPYEEIDATGNGSLISWLRRETGEVTFPRVFVYEKHIGGYEQLRSLEYAGALEKLLRGEGLDQFLKEAESAAERDDWTLASVREGLRGGKVLCVARTDGIELMMWAEVFANPPAVYYEGKKFPIEEFDRLLGAVMESFAQGEAVLHWEDNE
jgi:glutaredoxin 3